jgi:hypothetical protein
MRKSRLNKPKQEYSTVGPTARSSPEILNLHKDTVTPFFHKFWLLTHKNTGGSLTPKNSYHEDPAFSID